MENITVSILCGGKSTRMKSEKGLVLYQDKPFIEHIIEAILPITNNIQLITNSQDYNYLAYPKVKDLVSNKGPMGGIYSALQHSNNALNMILSCDIPFISTEVLKELIEKHDPNKEVSIWGDNENIHSLIGLYNKNILPNLKNALDEDRLKLMAFLAEVSLNLILIEDERRDLFRNINSRQELDDLIIEKTIFTEKSFKMIKTNIPKLTIVGAGPGDVELITLKAIKALANADVVLYDALINEELLQYAPKANCVFVGKRYGCHAYSQDQINELIVSMAKDFGHVVRLKGGDPFVFGRGSEEMDYARSFGLETAIVPGISSALGVPALHGISLTQRKISESFWVITGTTSEHQLSKDIILASQSSATVVILMGMHKLHEIVKIYQEERSDDLPMAIIQNGSKENEQKVIGTVSSIVGLAESQQLSSPAIIVIGEVVGHISELTESIQELSVVN